MTALDAIQLDWTKWEWTNEDAPARWILLESESGKLRMSGGRFAGHGDIQYFNGERIIAAGKLEKDGTVSGWISFDYNIETPSRLREPLQQFFRDNLASIQAKW